MDELLDGRAAQQAQGQWQPSQDSESRRVALLPQTLPRLIDSLRLNMGSAWLFLIAAEAIASTEGLGYRIFLVRRYLAMDVILPYVAWITLLAVGTDLLLRLLRARAFNWAEPGR